MWFKPNALFLLLCFILPSFAQGQTLVEDVTTPLSNDFQQSVFTETIKIISPSKKIFILSNNNQLLGVGDFVSLALDDKLAARAVVAKNHQGNTAIKILKIYSMALWSRLRKELEVQIIRGDDSWFGKKPEQPTEQVVKTQEPEMRIESEEDLYNNRIFEDGVELKEEGNRHIKPDNVISASYGFLDFKNIEKDTVRGNVMSAAWAYQFTDNYFIEGFYGYTLLKAFPSGERNLNTGVSRFVARLKYNIKAPLYSFFMPYIGYQVQSAASPSAGDTNNTVLAQQERDEVAALNKSEFVFGVTILRRLVPGWFVKADIGTDIMNIGVAIEF